MKNRTLLDYIWFACAVLALFSLVYYFYNFHHMPVSQKTSDWSNFGAYVAGTVGPLLSLVSVLFIIKSIKSTNDNHTALMTFSNNDKIVNQINVLSDTLKQSLKESGFFSRQNAFSPLGDVVANEIRKLKRLKFVDQVISIEDIAKDAIRYTPHDFESELAVILKIIELLNHLSDNDSEVYKTMLEVKLTNTERAVLYCFACQNHPDSAELINQGWPTFRGTLFNDPFSSPQDSEVHD